MRQLEDGPGKQKKALKASLLQPRSALYRRVSRSRSCSRRSRFRARCRRACAGRCQGAARRWEALMLVYAGRLAPARSPCAPGVSRNSISKLKSPRHPSEPLQVPVQEHLLKQAGGGEAAQHGRLDVASQPGLPEPERKNRIDSVLAQCFNLERALKPKQPVHADQHQLRQDDERQTWISIAPFAQARVGVFIVLRRSGEMEAALSDLSTFRCCAYSGLRFRTLMSVRSACLGYKNLKSSAQTEGRWHAASKLAFVKQKSLSHRGISFWVLVPCSKQVRFSPLLPVSRCSDSLASCMDGIAMSTKRQPQSTISHIMTENSQLARPKTTAKKPGKAALCLDWNLGAIMSRFSLLWLLFLRLLPALWPLEKRCLEAPA